MKKLFSPPEKATPQAHAAFQFTLIVLVTVALAAVIYLALAFQPQVWQSFAAVGACLVVACTAITTLWLIHKGRHILGMRILIGVLLVVPFFTAFIFSNNIASVVGIIVFVLNLLFAVRTLPPGDLPRITVIGLIAMGAAILLDTLAPASQLPIPVAGSIILISGGLSVSIGIFFILREFQNIPIASKLLLTFLTITIIPFFTLGFLLIQVTGRNLTDAAGNSLKTLSSSQAIQVGGILADEEESLRLLAINPVVDEQLVSINRSQANDRVAMQAALKQQEGTWKNLPDDHPQVQKILNHPITRELNNYLDTISDNFDVLVTDRYGAVVAATRRPLHYYVADQEWWQAALDGGDEDVYVSQPVIERPGDALSVFVAVPIIAIDTKEVIGVLRANYSMQTFAEVLKQETAGTRTGADLLLKDGKVYRVEGDIVTFDPATNANLTAITDKAYGQFFYDEGISLVSQSQVTTNDPDLAPTIEHLDWHLVHDIDSADALQSLKIVTEIGVFAGLAVLLLITFIALWLSRRISLPIIQLTETAQKIADGDLNAQTSVASKDEIGVLSTTFNKMTMQLRQTLVEVQQQTVALQSSTAALSRQTFQLRAATDVSRTVSSVLNADDLMQQAVDLVRDRFNLYYVSLFLLDETRSLAVLKAGTGEAGRQMLAAGRQLELNDDTLTGQSISRQQAVIAPSVQSNNPLLPNTRSKLSLPLISLGQVIGAITFQSEKEAAFGAEDVTILQTMADQLANGIEKARLYEQIQQRAIELDKAREAANSAKDDAEKARAAAESANRSLAAQMWQTTGQAALNNKMRGEQDITTLTHNVIQHLCRYLEVHSGAVYILDDKILRLAGTYAYRPRSFAQQYQVGEDLVGEAAVGKEIIINEVPEKYIAFDLRQGKILPKYRLVAPVMYNSQVSGVVALESMIEFTPAQKSFVELAIESVAIAFMTAQARTRVNELLIETRQQAEELQAQEEELRASNEELEAQAESLRSSESRIKTRQAAPKNTNP